MNDTPTYPDVTVQLTGCDGNAYAIMGAVIHALREAGVTNTAIHAYLTESMSGDYNHLLRTAMATVTVL